MDVDAESDQVDNTPAPNALPGAPDSATPANGSKAKAGKPQKRAAAKKEAPAKKYSPRKKKTGIPEARTA
jgi:hypothetical protein